MAKRQGKVIEFPGKTTELTVNQAAEEFLSRDFSPNTQKAFQHDLGRFIKAFSGQPASNLSSKQIAGYLGGLTGKDDKPVKPATYNRHYGTLNNFFAHLFRQEEIQVNPLARVERRRNGKPLPRPLSPGQIEAFFANIGDLRDRSFFSLLYRSGIRVSEALSLNVEDLKIEDGTFRIQGKGDKERVGYLGEETVSLVRRYFRGRGNPKSGPLFESREGRLSYPRAYQLFRGYAAGMKNPDGSALTIHQLRHTFGSERAGTVDPVLLRDMMGHENIRTTLQYSRVNPERTREAFRAFDRKHSRRGKRK